MRDLEEQKRVFTVTLASLESQKNHEKRQFQKALITLKRLYQSKASQKSDYNHVVNQLQEQIRILTDIRDNYDTKIEQLRTVAI